MYRCFQSSIEILFLNLIRGESDRVIEKVTLEKKVLRSLNNTCWNLNLKKYLSRIIHLSCFSSRRAGCSFQGKFDPLQSRERIYCYCIILGSNGVTIDAWFRGHLFLRDRGCYNKHNKVRTRLSEFRTRLPPVSEEGEFGRTQTEKEKLDSY